MKRRSTWWAGIVCWTVVISNPRDTNAEPVIVASRVATGLNRPVFLTAAPGDASRLYFLEQHTGAVRTLDRATGQVSTTPFLQLPAVSTGNEQGLLGLAFAPDYATSRQFFVNYTDRSGTTNVVGYRATSDFRQADTTSAQTVLKIPQPQANHNGGWLGFGPRDGYLYVASGDGGSGNDNGAGHTAVTGNAQDLTNNLLGKLLRIDTTGDDFPTDTQRNYAIPPTNPFVGRDGDDEIWAYGLRNPWRNGFDRATGDLYIGDVGQGAREEIDFQPATSTGGENYGWRLREGFIATPDVGGPKPAGAIDPIIDYPHTSGPTGGFSVTGGYVYRGPLTELQGHYFYADYVSNQIWSLRYDGSTVSDAQNRTAQIVSATGTPARISSFGEDHDGNLYLVSLDGDIYRVDQYADPEVVFPFGAEWKYLDNGSNQQADWRAFDFDASSWKSGNGELGYGDGDEATRVDFGGNSANRFVTTYFRREFQIDDPAQFDTVLIDLIRDDGAAVYLNGEEVMRTPNLSPNAAFDTLANFGGAAAIDGAAEKAPFSRLIDVSRLRSGRNVLAVEMHQHARNSGDLSFDLRVRAIRTAAITGDFDDDRQLDVDDIDRLTVAIRDQEQASRYDLNRDGELSLDDRMAWLHDVRRTWVGDTDLNGEFDSTDFIVAMQAGEYEDAIAQNSTWGEGDWNGDFEFDTSDFVAAFQDGGYERGPRAGVASVPEPRCWGLLGYSLLGAIPWVRRRS